MAGASVVTTDGSRPRPLRTRLALMHVPKTGGSALARALDGYVHRRGHKTRLEDMPMWPPIVTIVRDPVARWVSAWDMVYRQRHVPFFDQWPDASAAAVDPQARAWLLDFWDVIFQPQTFWLRDARYARERCWYIAHTETLTADSEVIREALGITDREMPTKPRLRNANQGEKSVLTPEAEAAIREHYASDYELLGGL